MSSSIVSAFLRRIVARSCSCCWRPSSSSSSLLSRSLSGSQWGPPLRAQGLRLRRDASTLGILRETYDPWERRAPLTPENVRNLLQNHPSGSVNDGDDGALTILVQPCRRRCYSDDLYESAGAIVTDDLSSAQVVLGVKRPHYDRHGELSAAMHPFRGKTLVLFSHVVKGQLDNMEFLQMCLDNRVQLLDYERMVSCDDGAQHGEGGDTRGNQPSRPPRRLVAFGRFAGMAGAVDSFAAIGKRLLYSPEDGMFTPFLTKVPPTWMHDDVEAAKASVRRLGESILQQGLPFPLVFAVTGQGGCVHGGVMEILKLLPHHLMPVSDLPMSHQRFKTSMEANHHRAVYIVPVSLSDSFERMDDGTFDRQDFQQNPDQYRSVFAKRVAPFVDVVFNCVYWDARFPRLLTKSQMKHVYEVDGPNTRLFHVTDISCDVNGSIEVRVRLHVHKKTCNLTPTPCAPSFSRLHTVPGSNNDD
jgi:alpha-aminoadipic semialdehyde synthase